MIPEVDPTGRDFAIMAFGPAAHSLAERWARRIEMADTRLWAWHGLHHDLEAQQALQTELRHARVGWRLMLTGPEADVAPATAQAIDHGALPAEIRTYTTPGPFRVYCPVCTTTTSTPGSTRVECQGCGHDLVIRRHFSPRLSAWLGVVSR